MKKFLIILAAIVFLGVSSCSLKILYSAKDVPVSSIQHVVDSIAQYQEIGEYTQWPKLMVRGVTDGDSTTSYTFVRVVSMPDGTKVNLIVFYNSGDSIAVIKKKEYKENETILQSSWMLQK